MIRFRTVFLLTACFAMAGGILAGKSLAQPEHPPAHFGNNFNPAKFENIKVGQPIRKKIQKGGETNLNAAVSAVNQMLKAWNRGDWAKVRQTVYNTNPVELPQDWFIKRPGAPVSYRLGTPYVLKNWTTPERGFIFEKQNGVGIGQMFALEFEEAVSVPVTIGNNPSPVLLHVIQDPENGLWKVAYSKLNGFELFDRPEELNRPPK